MSQKGAPTYAEKGLLNGGILTFFGAHPTFLLRFLMRKHRISKSQGGECGGPEANGSAVTAEAAQTLHWHAMACNGMQWHAMAWNGKQWKV